MKVSRPKILIVDDNEEVIFLFQKLLAPYELDLYEALNGNIALELVQKHDFFLIMMDIEMPELNGFDTAIQLQDNPSTSHVPIIFFSSLDKPENEEKAYAIGAVDYLHLPVKDELLRSKISIFLSLYNAKKQLEIEKEKAITANKAKDQFLAHMSHEIRTPMNGVLISLDLLSDSTLSPDQNKLVDIAKDSGHSLLTIINDILDVSKMEAGRIDLEHIPFDLNQLIEDTFNLMKIRAEAKGIRLEKKVSLPDIKFKGDPTRIKQILLNMMSNAIKFTEEGSVDLDVRCVENKSGLYKCTIEVSDTGIGIPKDMTESIFESFIQGDRSTTRKFGGTGLGMSISRSLAEIMQGSLTVKSVIDKGSTFTLTLPLEATKSQVAVLSQNERLNRNYNKKVLLVEDNVTNMLIAKKSLELLGITVTSAYNGQEALDKFNNSHDLILMDLEMPTMDGAEATEILIKSGCDIPIIALTANVMSKHKDKCIQLGMKGLIPKPIRKNELVSMLDKYLL